MHINIQKWSCRDIWKVLLCYQVLNCVLENWHFSFCHLKILCHISVWYAMAPHSSTLAWKIPWTEEPGGLQSMGSQRVRHDWATSFHFSLSCFGEGNGNSLLCSCLENPRDRGAWWPAIYRVAQSRTRLKWLSSSSSMSEKGWPGQLEVAEEQDRLNP